MTWSTSLVGSALQSYGVGALINATGTLSYKGAAYLGSLIFLATSAPTVSPLPPPLFIIETVTINDNDGANFTTLLISSTSTSS